MFKQPRSFLFHHSVYSGVINSAAVCEDDSLLSLSLSTAQCSCSPSKSQHTSSTSEAVPPPTLSQNRSFSLPPGHAVCCFMDGGVGLYDMGAKKWDFLRDLVFCSVSGVISLHMTDNTRRSSVMCSCSRVMWRPSLTASLNQMIPTFWPQLVLMELSKFGTQTH